MLRRLPERVELLALTHPSRSSPGAVRLHRQTRQEANRPPIQQHGACAHSPLRSFFRAVSNVALRAARLWCAATCRACAPVASRVMDMEVGSSQTCACASRSAGRCKFVHQARSMAVAVLPAGAQIADGRRPGDRFCRRRLAQSGSAWPGRTHRSHRRQHRGSVRPAPARSALTRAGAQAGRSPRQVEPPPVSAEGGSVGSGG